MKKLILLVLLVLAVFLFFRSEDLAVDNNNSEEETLIMDAITGQATLTYQSCFDSDEGLNFDEKGSVQVKYLYKDQIKKVSLDDECSDNIVKEYYCSGKRHRLREHPCEVRCVDGACLN